MNNYNLVRKFKTMSYFQETLMYKRNGNISISGLTPEMFESATDPILECSNLYKVINITITKWKEMCDNSIVQV